MSDDQAVKMDYEMHEGTYEGFLTFSKVGTIAVLNIVLCLIIFAFGSGILPTVVGWIMMIANAVAFAAGIAMGPKGWVPAAVVMVLTGLLAMIIT